MYYLFQILIMFDKNYTVISIFLILYYMKGKIITYKLLFKIINLI